MPAAFTLAASGSFIIHATVENKKPLLDTVHCFSQAQSPSTAEALYVIVTRTRFPIFAIDGTTMVD